MTGMRHGVGERQRAAIVDVETTGWSAAVDEIIEAAVLLFEYDPVSSEILGGVDSYSGLREPAVGIHPAAEEVHGISLDALKGRALDKQRMTDLLFQAGFVVAHNAGFDRAFLSRLLPETAHMPWLCSMRGIDWLAAGCPGRSLDILRSHFGLHGNQHRAGADTAATLQLISRRDVSGRPYFGQLLDRVPEKIAQAAKPIQALCPDRKKIEKRYFRPVFGSFSQTISFGNGQFNIVTGRLEVRIEERAQPKRDPRPQARELMELLAGIVADGVIDADEFRALDQWLLHNADLARDFPYNLLIRQLSAILASGGVTVEGLARLHEVILQVLHPGSLGCIDLSTIESTPMTQPPPEVEFAGKNFVFTGSFYFGEKGTCEQATKKRGGVCAKGVTRATDYVVVGGKGSPEWLHGSYGSKIEKAIANVRSGFATAVISEAHWASALDRTPAPLAANA